MAWKHYVCEVKERRASVLVDQRFQNQFPLKELPQILWLGIYCHSPSEGTVSSPDDAQTLERIESDLINLSQSFGHGWMVHVLQIRTPGIREYYFYYGKHAETDKIAVALRALHPTYRIEVDVKEDPQWVEYRNYVSFEPSTGEE